MNRHQIEGTWEQLLGQLKTSLGKLIDNELLQLEGRRDQVLGAARKSYGAAATDADRGIDFSESYAGRAADRVDSAADTMGSTAASAGRAVRNRTQDAIDALGSQASYLSDQAERGVEELGRAARNAPINTKALAVGILLIVVGLLSSR